MLFTIKKEQIKSKQILKIGSSKVSEESMKGNALHIHNALWDKKHKLGFNYKGLSKFYKELNYIGGLGQ